MLTSLILSLAMQTTPAAIVEKNTIQNQEITVENISSRGRRDINIENASSRGRRDINIENASSRGRRD